MTYTCHIFYIHTHTHTHTHIHTHIYINLKGNQPWILIRRTDDKAETLVFGAPDGMPTHSKSPWCWERLRAEGEESIRGWDGWMGSLMQQTGTWANFRRWWETERAGVLQSTGSQGQKHLGDWIITAYMSIYPISIYPAISLSVYPSLYPYRSSYV